MIIDALYQYYERLVSESDSGISPPGYSSAKVSFAFVLSREGQLLHVIDLRTQKGKRLVPREMIVPEQLKRAVNISPNFLCDNGMYVLGIIPEDSKKKAKPERSKQAFESFYEHHCRILERIDDASAKALLSFLEGWDPIMVEKNPVLAPYLDELKAGANIVFMLESEKGYIHEHSSVRKVWAQYKSENTSQQINQCLVTGEVEPIARLHPNIKGVVGAQSSGASLVSFNLDAFESYGKKQSYNAPVGERAAFAYTTALNFLLNSERHRIRIGDTTTVFWAERSFTGNEEDLLAELLFPSNQTQDEKVIDNDGESRHDPETVRWVRDVLFRFKEGKAVEGAMDAVDPSVRFYILGISPNASRLAIRFWNVDTFGSLIEKIGRYYSDMALVKPEKEMEFIPIYRILKEIAALGDSKNIPPIMAGALMRSIFMGTSYPHALYTTMLSRIRADYQVNYVRASMIKAYLLRNARINKNKKLEVMLKMSLNSQTGNTAYRLGRLFAYLEKAQQDATPGLNATIKDRYFGAASATPGSVFPLLIRLAQHHIAKSDYGFSTDKRIEEIMVGIEKFPTHLNLEEQGLFVLGYYHQRQAIYQKSEKKEG